METGLGDVRAVPVRTARVEILLSNVSVPVQFQGSEKDAVFCFTVAGKVHVVSTVHVTADMKCALERDLGLCCSHGNEGEALGLHSCHPVCGVEKCIPSFSMEIHMWFLM